MKRAAGLLFVMALVCLLLTGCAVVKQPPPKIDYYALEYEPAPVKTATALPVVLKVERFFSAPGYDTDRMVYRDADHKRATYFYHKWFAQPAEMVTFFLRRDLSTGRLFKGVVPAEGGTTATHVIKGVVEEFLEWDKDKAWEAVLTVNVVLIDAGELDASGRIIFQQRFFAREKCVAGQPAMVAEAMSRAMAGISAEIGEAVYSALKQ